MLKIYLWLSILLILPISIAKATNDYRFKFNAGAITFAKNFDRHKVAQAAHKLKRGNSNFKYMSVAQCGRAQYCIYFLYNNVTGDIAKLVEESRKEYGKKVIAASVGRANIICIGHECNTN